jgi:hypothetical protein
VELLNRGTRYNSRNRLIYNDLGWKANNLNELTFSEVIDELFENKIIENDKIYHPIFHVAKLYQHKLGKKYWEPSSLNNKPLKTILVL